MIPLTCNSAKTPLTLPEYTCPSVIPDPDRVEDAPQA